MVWLVYMMRLVVVVVVVLFWAGFSFGLRFRFGVGFCLGVRRQVEEDLVLEV